MPRLYTIAVMWILVGSMLAFQLGQWTAPRPSTAVPSVAIFPSIIEAPLADIPNVSVIVFEATPEAFLNLRSNEAFQACFENFLPSFGNPDMHDSLLVLADVWASFDPVAATEWIANLKIEDRRNPYLFASLSQWAMQDPDAAVAWFNLNRAEVSDDRDYMLASLIRGVAGVNPQRALQMLLAAPNSPERSGAMDCLLQAWSQEGVEYAFEQVLGLPAIEGVLKERAMETLINNLAMDDIFEIQALAARMANPEERRVAQVAIAARLSQREPRAASEWVAALADSQTRKSAYGKVGARWARIDPIAASEWLALNEGVSEFDLAARGVAWATVGIDPDAAFAQVATIVFQPLREETFEQVGRFWVARQPNTAREFLSRESELPDAIRTRLLEIYE